MDHGLTFVCKAVAIDSSLSAAGNKQTYCGLVESKERDARDNQADPVIGAGIRDSRA